MSVSARRGKSGIACLSEDGGFFHCEVNRGGVCVWVRTDSSATPLPKTINCLNPPAVFLNESGWNKTEEEDTWVFLSLAKVENFPTLILVKIMPLSHFSCRDRSWSGYLIKYAYVHDEKA